MIVDTHAHLDMKKVRKSVAGIIRNDRGEILLLRRGPKASHERGKWENIGGKINEGETAEEAIRREVKEELGVVVEDLKHLIFTQTEIGGTLWRTNVFEVGISGTPSIQEPEKCSQIRWFRVNQLSKIPLASYFKADLQKLDLRGGRL